MRMSVMIGEDREWERSPGVGTAARTMPWIAATAGKSSAAARQAFLIHATFRAKTQAATRT